MALFGSRAPKPDKTTPFLAPEPEGPEQISARTDRPKASKHAPTIPEDSRKGPARTTSTTSPHRTFLVGLVATSQAALVATGVLTDLPLEWLLSLAFVLLTFLYPFPSESENTGEDAETGERRYYASSDSPSHHPGEGSQAPPTSEARRSLTEPR